MLAFAALAMVGRAQTAGAQDAHAADTARPSVGVELHAEPCEALPFDPERVRALLGMELALEGMELLDAAETVVRYAPVDCAPGVTRFAIVVRRGDAERQAEAWLDDTALAAVPRALALHLAETLRAMEPSDPRGPSEPAPGTDASLESEPSSEAGPTVPVQSESADTESADTESADTESAGTESADTEPTGPAAPGSTPRSEPFAAGDTPSVPTGSAVRLGGLSDLRNTPESGALMGSARLLVDLALAEGLPLLVRLDFGASVGADPRVRLGSVDGGVSVLLEASAASGFDLRFGPRLAVGHAFALDPAERRSGDVQVAAGLRVGGAVALGEGVSMLVEAEVGTNLVDFELGVAGQRAGWIGAYWSVGLGLAVGL